MVVKKMSSEDLAEGIGKWIKRKVSEAGAAGAVVGMSGGVDSSVVAVLCKKALGENVLGVIMPSNSSPDDEKDAMLVAEKFKIKTARVELKKIFEEFIKALPPGSKLAEANLKPRLRMSTLYYLANTRNYIVAGTGNKSEEMIGYFTKYGDGGVDILPIGGIYKKQVRELARHLGIPDRIITKAPTAGLWPGQTDEGEMGITYENLDRILEALDKGDTRRLDMSLIKKVKDMTAKSQHKRVPPPVFEI